LLFLYRQVLDLDPGPVAVPPDGGPKRPQHLPAAILTPQEVRQVITALSGVSRLIIQLLYGAGLRLIECLRLRVGDVDFEYGQTRAEPVEASPCATSKARRTMSPCSPTASTCLCRNICGTWQPCTAAI